jgi:tRNA threonylcarbamoyl adenosine modification protein YeaZ
MTRGPLILALDTSTETCSVAVLAPRGDRPVLVSSRVGSGGRGHTRDLLVLCQEALTEAGAGAVDVGGVVVGIGPGTFTGVRIAVATARGLALSLGVPVTGVSSLAALAAAALESVSTAAERARAVEAAHDPACGVGWPELVVPLLDAHRGQLFGAVYRRTDGLWVRQGSLFAAGPDKVEAEVRARGGEGAALFVGKTEHVGTAAGRAVPASVDAAFLVLGQERLVDREGAGQRAEAGSFRTPGMPGSPEAVLPIYVRAPDADLHIKKMRDPWA